MFIKDWRSVHAYTPARGQPWNQKCWKRAFGSMIWLAIQFLIRLCWIYENPRPSPSTARPLTILINASLFVSSLLLSNTSPLLYLTSLLELRKHVKSMHRLDFVSLCYMKATILHGLLPSKNADLSLSSYDDAYGCGGGRQRVLQRDLSVHHDVPHLSGIQFELQELQEEFEGFSAACTLDVT